MANAETTLKTNSGLLYLSLKCTLGPNSCLDLFNTLYHVCNDPLLFHVEKLINFAVSASANLNFALRLYTVPSGDYTQMD